MSKAIAFADRASGVALGLIALANLLFVLSVLAVLLVGVNGARASALPICSGTNMLEQLQRDDPGKIEDIRRQAEAMPNGHGLLWKIEKDGAEPSFLFGTMHLTDERVTRLTDKAQAAFNAADTVIIETTDVLDEQAAALSLMRHPELMMLPGTTTLKSLLSPEQAEIVDAALNDRGIPLGSVSKMQPWMLATMVAIPACEFARRKGGLKVLDVKLARDAAATGKTVAGLETAIEQLQAMASLPLELHVESLVETMKLGDRIGDVYETMVDLYQTGEVGMIWPLFRAVLPSKEDEGYAEFEETMVTSRNRGMAENAEPFLQQGGAFIAVGALHLPGEKGLVELLRRAGYRVTRAD
ncbi:MAG: TraB/GumN family protein [Rhizobiaceae bacterium]